MNTRHDRSVQIGAEDVLLQSVEGATTQKTQDGWADEARYGFAALVANATPPVDDVFQQTLRKRLLAKVAAKASGADGVGGARQKGRLWATGLRRLAVVGGLAGVLILALAVVVARYMGGPEPGRMAPATGAAPGAAPAAALAAQDVEALASRLNREPAGQTMVVYPGGYAASLAGRIDARVVPLVPEGGLDPAAIQAALASVLPVSGLVDVVLIAGEGGEAAREVQIALEQHLYRLYGPGGAQAGTYGPLAWSRFVAGPQEAALEPIGAVFQGGIELVSGAALDEPQPGAPLRLALDWRTREVVDASPQIFAHLVHEEGRLLAQRDAAPGNGLFPVESWEPDRIVRDQFALLLPPELPPGEVQIQVGIYDPVTQMRYGLVEPEAESYVVVGQFTVEAGTEK